MLRDGRLLWVASWRMSTCDRRVPESEAFCVPHRPADGEPLVLGREGRMCQRGGGERGEGATKPKVRIFGEEYKVRGWGDG